MECRQVESSKKVCQPPSKQKQPVNTALSNRSTAIDCRAIEKKSSTTLVSSARQYGREVVSSSKASCDSASKISTATKRQNRSGHRNDESAVSVSENNCMESQNGEPWNQNSRQTFASTENSFSNDVSVADTGASSHPAPSDAVPSGNRRLSDVNEPTKQPVAARLAAWKKKTAAMENASTLGQHSVSRDRLYTISEARGNHRLELDDRDSRVDMRPQTKTSSCAAHSTGKVSDAVAVARGIADDCGKAFPPLKEGEVRQRTLPRRMPPAKQEAMQPSWKKLGPATFEIQQKLTAMCESWKQNEIAAKSRKERAEDLAVLETRWRSGILADEPNEAITSAVTAPSTVSGTASHTRVLQCL